jgi:hypothetical protein
VSNLRVAHGAGGTGSHLPSGQRSVAMRSFAHVEHLQMRHRPVPPIAVASHSGQAWHVASRAVRMSGGVTAKPEAVHVTALEMTRPIASGGV